MVGEYRWSSIPNDMFLKIVSLVGLPRDFSITMTPTTFNIKLGNQWDIFHNFILNLSIFISPSIDTFSGNPPHPISPIVNSWARQLRSRCNMKHFNITTDCNDLFPPNNQLYAPSISGMDSLVSLDLKFFKSGCVWINHESINLPNLKKFNIDYDDYDFLERLINSCLLLEDLSFTIGRRRPWRQAYAKETLSVSSKIIKRLRVRLFKYAEFLCAGVTINTPEMEHLNFVAPWNSTPGWDIFIRMFGSISHVKSLVLDFPLAESLWFPNTKLNNTFTHEYNPLVLMLRSCPNLEVLVLGQCDYWLRSIQEYMFMSLEHVKRIELNMFYIKLDNEFLGFATCLLRSAPVLEKLILNGTDYYPDGTSKEKFPNFYRSLLESPMCSSACQIELLGIFQSLACSKD